jgi:hypothetical protein
MNFQDWVKYKSKLKNRDVSQDQEDYDLEGYYNSLKMNPIEGDHLPDTFKKPNHPTFSDQSKYSVPVIQQGGVWDEEGIFTPSEHNLKNMSSQQLQRYFNEVESPEALNLPKSKRFSKIMEKLK